MWLLSLQSSCLRPVALLILTLLLVLLPGGAGAVGDTPSPLQTAANLLRSRQYHEALQQILTAPPSGRRSLMAGVTWLHLDRPDEALPYLLEAERGYPLLADYAIALQAKTLMQLQRFREAAASASRAAALTHAPSLRRQMEKLSADALLAGGDLKGARAAYQQFASRYHLGGDRVDATYQDAVCRERLGDPAGALREYRQIWLHHPAAPQADKAFQAMGRLDSLHGAACSGEELYQRATLLLAAGHTTAAAGALAAIPLTNMADPLASRIALKSGQAAMRQHKFTQAETFLARAATAGIPSVRDEARLFLARVEARNKQPEQALARLLRLASEKGPLADDALLDAGFIQKQAGRFREASLLFERLQHDFPRAATVGRATWKGAWCRYLAGDLPIASDAFLRLQQTPLYREQALYWYARTQERQNKSQKAATAYNALLTEYPFGFYATWYRKEHHIATGWEPLSPNLPQPPLPASSERIVALASCGLFDEARTELNGIPKTAFTKDQSPGLARLQQLINDPHGSIVTFYQNHPSHWDRQTLPFWALGYPRPFAGLFAKAAAAARLEEGMVLALAKAESDFRPEIRSPVGAIGLMQLMPHTARVTAGYRGKKPYNPLWLTDPAYNIRLGTRHLRHLLDQFYQDTVYTLAAYNAGSGAVNRWRTAFGNLSRDEFIENIPYKETRDYVKRIVAATTIYNALYRLQ